MRLGGLPIALQAAILAAPALVLAALRARAVMARVDAAARRILLARCAIVGIASFCAVAAAVAAVWRAEGRLALPAAAAALVAGAAAMALARPLLRRRWRPESD